ncbi:MAG: hypothetical protein ACREYE_21540 [Gammaproteobacteria bacterium]
MLEPHKGRARIDRTKGRCAWDPAAGSRHGNKDEGRTWPSQSRAHGSRKATSGLFPFCVVLALKGAAIGCEISARRGIERL